MTSGGCSQCEILTEVIRQLEVKHIRDTAESIRRLSASTAGFTVAQLAHAFKLPPETIEAIARSRET